MPLYTFVNPVDDALMEHHPRAPRRGPAARPPPRQLALYAALIGCGSHDLRAALRAHAARAGARPATRSSPSATREADLFLHRDRGFIPEGLLNYLALLGWSIGHDRDVFSLEEFVAAFDIVERESRTRPASIRRRPNRSTATTSGCSSREGLRRARSDAVPGCRTVMFDEPTREQRRARRSVRRHSSRTRVVSCWGRRPGTARSFLFTDEASFATIRPMRLKGLPANAAEVLDACVLRRWTPVEDFTPEKYPGCSRQGARGGSGAQAPGRIRTPARRHHGTSHLAAAVRVDAAHRQGRIAAATARALHVPGVTARPSGAPDPPVLVFRPPLG